MRKVTIVVPVLMTKLPVFGVVEDGPQHGPDDDHQHSDAERRWRSGAHSVSMHRLSPPPTLGGFLLGSQVPGFFLSIDRKPVGHQRVGQQHATEHDLASLDDREPPFEEQAFGA